MSGTQLSATESFTFAHTATNGSAALDAEVAAYDAQTGLIFVIGATGVDAIDAATGAILGRLDTSAFGGINSVAAKDGVVALALQDATKTDPGVVMVADVVRVGDVVTVVPRTFGGLPFVQVGALPDQIGFTPDGTKLLVANEGEPNSYGQADSADPAGSVSIIDLVTGTVQTATFTAFNADIAALRAEGVRIFGPGATVAQDLEPEYIAVDPNDPTKAYVTLQEANAIAVLDIATATFTDIIPLGFKNHGLATNAISGNDQDNVFAPATFDNVFGMYQPDGIAAVDVGGTTYLITANEGDARDYTGFAEEARISTLTLDPTAFPDDPNDADATPEIVEAIGRLTVTTTLGDTDNDGDYDQLYAFGGRSFSVWNTDGTLVFDSGNMLDQIIATQFPGSYDENRDDNKGVEPESITIGQVGDDTFVFVALERADGVAAFRMDGPADFTFAGFFTTPGADAPEVITFVPAEDAPDGVALLVVPNEDSATTSVFELEATFTLQILSYYGESGLLGTETAPIMGALIDRFDNEYANTLVLGEGDSFIPGPWLVAGADPSLSPLLGIAALGRADIAIMNAFGTDASALGNHEFDLGSPVLQGAITPSGAWVGAQFPFITANLNFAADSSLRGLADASLGGTSTNAFAGDEVTDIKGKIAPYAISTQGDERIGIVGLTTWELLTKTSPNGTRPLDDGNDATSDLQEVAAYVQAAVDALTALGVDKIVMVDQLDTLARNKALAPLVHGIDIMVAGGGHERIGDANDIAAPFNGHDANFSDTFPILTAGSDGAATLIVTTDTEYTYLGRLVVDFDADGEIITANLDPAINGAYASTEAVLQAAYDTTDSAADIIAGSTIGTQVQAITNAIDAVVAAKEGNTFGYSNVYLEGDRVFGRTQEVNLGNITADANLDAAADALGAGALVVSLKNGGGIRASIGSVAEDGTKQGTAGIDGVKDPGEISQLDIENALRFDNRLMVFDTTAQGLLNILNFAAGLSSGPSQQSGGYMQLGGLRVSYDPDSATGAKVANISVIDADGIVIARIAENGVVSADAPALISMVTLNFTANGGDGYPIKANGENFRYLLTDGTLSAAVSEALDFTAETTMQTVGASLATVLGEQKAFQDFLAENHATPETAYDVADTNAAGDTRIQNLNARAEDTVLEGIVVTGSGQLRGSAGDDTVTGSLATDVVLAGIGDDRVDGSFGKDSINGGGGADTLLGGNGDDSVDGGTGADSIDGGAGFNSLLGGNGDDTVRGGFRNDTIDGGADNDLVDGAAGNDSLLGGEGNDRIDAGLGSDTVAGGGGGDTILGGVGFDRLAGDAGADLIEGGAGLDTLLGGADNDTLRGGDNTDTIDGGADNDLIDGGIGADSLAGGEGADTIRGDFGQDTILGGAGDDLLIGGALGDIFVFGAGGGDDTITDFGLGDALRFEDVISVSDDAVIDADADGMDDLLLTLSDGGTITLINVTKVALPVAEIF